MTVAAPPKIEKKEAGASRPGSFAAKLASWLSLALKIVAWQVVAILIVEFTLSLAGLGEEEIFKLDPRFGFVHMNNKRITWRSEGYSKSFFGADGMREKGLTIEKPAGVFRVALLGDSIVESLQVPFEETFGQILEKSLKKTADGKNLQVLNFGNSGYSTAQEYLQLKNKVLKYSPDAVIVFYNHRDIFENWAPPDQTLTNVRPYALHLPNQPLTIDNSSVTQWMKSPRGKFLMSINWIRENSRIWGLIAAWETQASFHDPVYRAVMGFLTSPSKSLKAAAASLKSVTPKMIVDSIAQTFKPNAKPASFNIKFIDEKNNTKIEKASGNPAQAAAKPTGQSKKQIKEELDPAKASYILDAPELTNFPGSKVDAQKKDAEIKAAAAKAEEAKAAKKGQTVYLNLMFKTLRSLLSEMKEDCQKHGAKFAVAIAPSKLALVETADSIGLMDLTYEKEIVQVKQFCSEAKIPCIDMQHDLQELPRKEADKLFYSMHLTKEGHKYVVSQAQQLFAGLIGNSTNPQ